MAQSVAHFIGSEEVTGSIPVASLQTPSKINGFGTHGFNGVSIRVSA